MWIHGLGDGGVQASVGDVRPIAAVQDLELLARIGVGSQLLDDFLSGLGGNELQGLLQRHLEEESRSLQVPVGASHLDVGAVSADAHRHLLSRPGVGSQGPGEGEEEESVIQAHIIQGHAFRKAHALGLLPSVPFAQLNVRSVRAHPGHDGQPRVRILSQGPLLDFRGVQGPGTLALGISGASQESAKLVPADQHGTSTDVTGLPLRFQELPDDFLGMLLPLLQLASKGRIELLKELSPGNVPFLHPIQLSFHPTGEAHVENVGKNPHQKPGYGVAQGGGTEPGLLHLHVSPVLDGGNDLGVGGGPADAQPLQLFHQAGLAEAGWRLGEVLVRLESLEVALIPLLQRREGLQVVQSPVVPGLGGLLVETGEAGKLHHGARGPEEIAAARGPIQGEVHSGRVIYRRGHLAGHESKPDELVEVPLVRLQVLPGLIRVKRGVGGPDGLVGLLGPFLLFSVKEPGRGGQICFSHLSLDPAPGLIHRRRSHPGGVGPHVGDEPRSAFGPHLDTLIEPLGRGHGLSGRKAEPLGRGLLHGGGGEGWEGVLPSLSPLHLRYHEGPAPDVLQDRQGFLLGR